MPAVLGSRSEVEALICAGLFRGVLMSTSSRSGRERRCTPSVVEVGVWRSSGTADDRRGLVLSTAAPGMFLRLLGTDVESALSLMGEVATADVVVVCGMEVGLWLA